MAKYILEQSKYKRLAILLPTSHIEWMAATIKLNEKKLSRKAAMEFCKLCAWAYETWSFHETMGHSPKMGKLFQNEKYKGFLGRLGRISLEYTVLQIVKLHDPAVQKGGTNLTLDYVIKHGNWVIETRLQLEKLKAELEELLVKGDLLSAARNKIVSHNDLEIILGGKPIGKVSTGNDRKYFEKLKEFVNIVHEKTIGGSYVIYGSGNRDANNFIDSLAIGG